MASLIRHSRRTGASLPLRSFTHPIRSASTISPVLAPSENDTPRPTPREEPRFQYGDVLILNDNKGDRRLIGPLKKGISRDNHIGRMTHDQIVGKMPMDTVETHKGAKYTLHWPTLDEYCTTVKRQASIMYPKDATSAVHLLDLFPGAHVLEAGTGNGSMTMYIQRAIMAPGSHLDTVDIRNEHSLQAEQNIERFWRGMYRPGITFWRSVGGLQRVIRRLTGKDHGLDGLHSGMGGVVCGDEKTQDSESVLMSKDGKPLTDLEIKRKQLTEANEILHKNPHPVGHQYDSISLDLPDCKSVLLDLYPLLKPDRPLVLYMVNMSQILEMVQWLRKKNFDGYTVEKVIEVDWKEWSVRSAAVRSKVKGRVRVGGFGDIIPLTTSNGAESAPGSTTPHTLASDNIPDDAVGWICRPLHMPVGHTGFLVQLRKNSADYVSEEHASEIS
ncbi:hypothetical protein CPC16_001187 [Podila verticillata]|nr:hypothetical protein CPC16_001187 [Podila verticillata]